MCLGWVLDDPEWISEISQSLDFKELFRYTFKTSGHINVNETRTSHIRVGPKPAQNPSLILVS